MSATWSQWSSWRIAAAPSSPRSAWNAAASVAGPHVRAVTAAVWTMTGEPASVAARSTPSIVATSMTLNAGIA